MTEVLIEIKETEVLLVRSSEDVVLVRTAVRRFAQTIRFGLVDQTKIVTAASEIARNTLDYGGGGEARIENVRRLDAGQRTGLRLIFTDKGPGIPDIARALTDGWTSGKGMGLGLGGTKRLMDDFQIASKAGEGTTVTITKWSR